jgi:hypothetical protein
MTRGKKAARLLECKTAHVASILNLRILSPGCNNWFGWVRAFCCSAYTTFKTAKSKRGLLRRPCFAGTIWVTELAFPFADTTYWSQYLLEWSYGMRFDHILRHFSTWIFFRFLHTLVLYLRIRHIPTCTWFFCGCRGLRNMTSSADVPLFSRTCFLAVARCTVGRNCKEIMSGESNRFWIDKIPIIGIVFVR